MRKVENLKLARLSVDIKDFDPAGVPGLDNGAAPWVAIGKHLCGAATDFTLRCCASSLHALDSCIHPTQNLDATAHANPTSHQTSADSPEEHDKDTAQQSSACATIQSSMPSQARPTHDPDSSKQPAAATDSSDVADKKTDAAQARQLQTDKSGDRQVEKYSGSSRHGIQGLAVATCCHHRCSWQHYVGKPTFRQLGFTPEDFEVMSWMTGVIIKVVNIASTFGMQKFNHQPDLPSCVIPVIVTIPT